jgi:exosome complex component CSL4
MDMNNEKDEDLDKNWVVPGDKIAVIEEFLPDETCYEQGGEIYSRVFGHVITDPKKHKITVIPKNPINLIRIGDIGIGRVEFVKKQIASVNIYQMNKKEISLPISSVLHVSEASRRFIRNMFEVARPGDWLKFRIIRAANPVYISLIGDGLGVIFSYCIRCGYELSFQRRNLLECPNCEYIQPRITAESYGRPLFLKLGSFRDEKR